MGAVISARVAETVIRRRKALGLTRAQLAKRCADLGNGITAASLNNIETGRPSKDGIRRRHITIDELLVLAKALEISPGALCPDLGIEDIYFRKYKEAVEKIEKAVHTLAE